MIILILAIELFKKKQLQLVILLIASYAFYYFDSGFLFVLLLFSSLLDFYCGRKIYETENTRMRRFFLTLSLLGNLGILAYFKYTNFGIETINNIGGLFGLPELRLLNIILPVGISFFTFQTMSYTLDIYRKTLKPINSFLKFALFVAFFPQLVAGPIVRAADFLPQLDKEEIKIYGKNLKLGLTLIGWGFIKKIVFADNIAPFVDSIFSNPLGLGSFPIIIGTLAFGIQIYCDFSGYTDIATGCALIFGFILPKNFDKPYLSKSISEFWNKWHISLSSWFQDYVFRPFYFFFYKIKSFRNLNFSTRHKISFILSTILGLSLLGLWHGANWTFILFGTYNGILIILYHLNKKYWDKMPNLMRLLLTQYFVFIGWILFRANNLTHAIYAIKKYVVLDFASNLPEIISFSIQNKFLLLLIFLFLYLHIFSYKTKDIVQKINSLKLIQWFFYIAFVVLLLLLFSPSLNTAFIYFQF